MQSENILADGLKAGKVRGGLSAGADDLQVQLYANIVCSDQIVIKPTRIQSYAFPKHSMFNRVHFMQSQILTGQLRTRCSATRIYRI